MAVGDGEPEILAFWSARKLPPIVLLYVVIVFVVFMAMAYFVYGSIEAVKALVAAAFATLLPLTLGINSRLEYRLTERGLERRPLNPKQPKDYTVVFRLDRVDHIVRTAHGFKFYLPLDEANPLRRFWKAHLSDAYSGEVRVDAADQERVVAVLNRYGVSCR